MDYYNEDNLLPAGSVAYPFSSHIETHACSGVIANAHYHEYIEILYCLEGRLTVRLGSREYLFSTGDMLIINSKEIHYIIADSDVTRYIVVKFTPDMLYTSSKFLSESQYVLPFLIGNSAHQKLFPNAEIGTTFIPELFDEILTEYCRQEYGFELAIRTDICRIFLWILRGWYRHGALPDQDFRSDYQSFSAKMKKLAPAIEFASRQYSDNISALEAAKLCSMSYSYFSRLFKKSTGRSFSEYLTDIRITEAEKLLATTEMNITEVAGQTGFATSSYFIQQFKSRRKTSPKQYRKRFQQLSSRDSQAI